MTDEMKIESTIASLDLNGQSFRSFAELVRTLGLEVKRGSGKKTQENLVSRFMEYEKTGKGHQIIVKKVFDAPVIAKAKDYPMTNSVYYHVLHELLILGRPVEGQKNTHSATITKSRLKVMTRMCNENFHEGKKYQTVVEKHLDIPRKTIEDFFESAKVIDREISKMANELKRAKIITNYATSKLGCFVEFDTKGEKISEIDLQHTSSWRPIAPHDDLNVEIQRLEDDAMRELDIKNKFIAHQRGVREKYYELRTKKLLGLGLKGTAESITFYFDHDKLNSVVESFEFEESNTTKRSPEDYIQAKIKTSAERKQARLMDKEDYLTDPYSYRARDEYLVEVERLCDIMISSRVEKMEWKKIYEESKH